MLNTLGRKLLSDIWFTNILFSYVNCFFTFLMVYVETETFLIMKFYLCVFSLITWVFGIMYKKLLYHPRLQRFTPVFFPNSFTVLTVTFRSMIHFNVFVHGVREGSNFILLRVNIQLFHYHSLKRLFHKLHWILKNQWPQCMGLFLYPQFYSTDNLILLPHCCGYCSFVISLKWGVCVLQVCPFFKIVFSGFLACERKPAYAWNR